MIAPQRALVRPRAIAPVSHESLLLEDLLADFVQTDIRQPIQIVGGPGSGKTTALRHLAFVLKDRLPALTFACLAFLDEPATHEEVAVQAQSSRVVLARTSPFAESGWPALRLALWGEDDFLDYLRGFHRQNCAAVLKQLRRANDAWKLEGIPELCTFALSYMASHGDCVSAMSALRLAFLDRFQDPDILREALTHSLALIPWGNRSYDLVKLLSSAPNAARLLRHAPTRHALAAHAMAKDLEGLADCLFLEKHLPRSIVELLADFIRELPKAQSRILAFLADGPRLFHPTAASVWHKLDCRWLLNFSKGAALPDMTGAYLDRAEWPGIDLHDAQLMHADLSHSQLQGASLQGAVVRGANFTGASLAAAVLHGIKADKAVFTNADLSDAKADGAEFTVAAFQGAKLDGASINRAKLTFANFTGASLVNACFKEADLQHTILADADCADANFTQGKLTGVDFRTVRLDGASFQAAQLQKSNFEGVSMPEADFRKANLDGALLTQSSMPQSNFAGARLCNAGLAEIDWEGADLSGSDLRGASFHFGSSRSGLVGSPIAREGSMTGFYTDDYTEQDFKSPEEIRKANLRGADLRRANIEDVDFYLVDLREALYDEEQAKQLRATGAILRNRAEGGTQFDEP